jgi:hypothetical protein
MILRSFIKKFSTVPAVKWIQFKEMLQQNLTTDDFPIKGMGSFVVFELKRIHSFSEFDLKVLYERNI